MYDAFISYKREDRDYARRLAEAIASYGYKVWWDIELLPGDKFSEEIEAVIRNSSATIVLWSEKSVQSDFVRAEASLALKNNRLIPLRLDNTELPLPFGEIHTLDISTWKGEPDNKVLSALFESIEKATGHPAEKIKEFAVVKEVLAQPEGEAEYWRAISNNSNQSSKEYELYIEKYGQEALFYELAILRINNLNKSKKLGTGKIIAGATAVLTLVILASQVYSIFFPNSASSPGVTNVRSKPLTDRTLVPDSYGTIIIDETFSKTGLVKADRIVVTKGALKIQPKTLLVANEVLFSNNSKLYGEEIIIIAQIIRKGVISATGMKNNSDGGDILVVADILDNTFIESSGIDGKNGAKGADGANGVAGANGRNGNCGGFGAWRSPHAGGNGSPGRNGTDGINGQKGGNAGNVVVLHGQSLSLIPSAAGGKGGKGGEGGRAGVGGSGGRGGSGCTGLGGSKPTQPNGAPGVDGKPGVRGVDGIDGKIIPAIAKKVDFGSVINIISEHDDIASILSQIKQL